MLMDLSCPVDVLGCRALRDSGGRAQAYCSLCNLTGRALLGLDFDLLLTSGEGEGASYPVQVDDLNAPPGKAFTLCIPLDDLPEFATLSLAVREAWFADGPDWHENPQELVFCQAQELPPGPERVALVSIAGEDAVRFPRAMDHAWACVCGRFNPTTATKCQRCGRGYRRTLREYNPEAVLAAYREQQATRRQTRADALHQADREEQRVAQRRLREYRAKAQAFQQKRRNRRLVWGLVMAMAATLALVCFILYMTANQSVPLSL